MYISSLVRTDTGILEGSGLSKAGRDSFYWKNLISKPVEDR